MLKNIVLPFVVLCTFIIPATTEAAKDWGTMTAGEFYTEIYKLMNSTSTSESKTVAVTYVYKSQKDKSPLYFYTESVGLFSNSNPTKLAPFDATSTIENGKGKKAREAYQMRTISDGTSVYVLFENAVNKNLRTKWIKMTPKEYAELGQKMNVTELFNVNKPQSMQTLQSTSQKVLAAQVQSGVLQVYPFEISDKITVKNATRYNFDFDADKLEDYYSLLQKSLTIEEGGEFSASAEEVNKLIADEDIRQYMADMSYYSVWIDNSTKLPVRLYSNVWIAVKDSKKLKPIQKINDVTIIKANSQKNIVAPTSTISITEAAKLLKIK